MTLTLLIVAALASTRIATLLITDTFGPIAELRGWIKYRWPDDDDRFLRSEVEGSDEYGWQTLRGTPVLRETEAGLDVFYAVDPHPLGRLWSCIRCMSVWSGLVVMAFILLAPAWVVWPVLLPFAFSQFSITLARGE